LQLDAVAPTSLHALNDPESEEQKDDDAVENHPALATAEKSNSMVPMNCECGPAESSRPSMGNTNQHCPTPRKTCTVPPELRSHAYQMNRSINAPSPPYSVHRVKVSKLADTDLSLGIDISEEAVGGESPFWTKPNRTKVLTIVVVQPGSVVEQMVKVGDIICFVQYRRHAPSNLNQRNLNQQKWTPVSDIHFRSVVARSKRRRTFSFSVARKKQKSDVASSVSVDSASQERRNKMETERAEGSQVKNYAPDGFTQEGQGQRQRKCRNDDAT
jgi:hypothetical protein